MHWLNILKVLNFERIEQIVPPLVGVKLHPKNN